ncbi:hypothetical protein PVX_121940 [Plasmodium vivax]|uniref:Uncharacterized protein n=1 Tax=Plasmodium vivax (strain Salvador I) TaxID=126793 RepID=A5JZ13_PLAVS|nr:hypothetical protein PVX_121940 [Plasmodium vivax]EDL47224.1 hypothetical protein PVX_121940 [Plasmodium vivax]|eukprot:XP_001616951.1 hypothetical protein [Plasmodium vivax Sal-1]
MNPTNNINTEECTIKYLRIISQGDAKNLSELVASPKGSNAQQGNADWKKTKKGNIVKTKNQKAITDMRRSREIAAEPRGSQEIAAEQRGSQEIAVEQRGSQEIAVEQRGSQEIAVVQRGSQEIAVVQRGSQEIAVEQRGSEEIAVVQRGSEEIAVVQRGSQEISAEQRINEKITFAQICIFLRFGETCIADSLIRLYHNEEYNNGLVVRIKGIKDYGGSKYYVKVRGTVTSDANEMSRSDLSIEMKVKRLYIIEQQVVCTLLFYLLHSDNREELLERLRYDQIMIHKLVWCYANYSGISFVNNIPLYNSINRISAHLILYVQGKRITETDYDQIMLKLTRELRAVCNFCHKLDTVIKSCNLVRTSMYPDGVKFRVRIAVPKRFILRREQYALAIAMFNMLLGDVINRIYFDF